MSRFTFDEAKHAYKLDGKRLTGVTTILGAIAKPALIGWAARMASDYIKSNAHAKVQLDKDGVVTWSGFEVTHEVLAAAKKAHERKRDGSANIGTRVHKSIENYLTGQPVEFETEQEEEMFEKLKTWADTRIKKVIATEIRVYDEELWYGGTCDLVYLTHQDRVRVADWKTSNGLYDRTYFAQCAAYANAMKKMGFEWASDIEGGDVVMAGKDGSFGEYRSDKLEEDFKIFEAALCIYRNNKVKRSYA